MRRVQFSRGRGTTKGSRVTWWPDHGQIGVRAFGWWWSIYWWPSRSRMAKAALPEEPER